jgi:hypothetical protein
VSLQLPTAQLAHRGQHRRCHYGSRIRRVVNTQSPRRSSLKQHPQDRCVTTHKGVLDRTASLLILRYRLVAMRTTHALRDLAHGDTLDRLHGMTVKLKDRLIEAEDIRVRFTKARDANRWPHLISMSRLFTDIQNPPPPDRPTRCAHPGDEVHLP